MVAATAALSLASLLAACSAEHLAPRPAPHSVAEVPAPRRQPAERGPSHHGGSSAVRTTLSREAEAARAAEALRSSLEDFYAAGRPGQSGAAAEAALAATFVPGSPALEHTLAFLAALHSAGVYAPATWRIGDVTVRSVTAAEAVVTACTFDTGSVYASGAPAPPSLGGGAGLTAAIAVLRRVHGRFLVWSDQTSTPSSAKEAGPCHGF
ncbi:MAG TPA: hypothetical protein VKU92_03265 [Acidimicrobiales bacterium]|nr:hypothetical protein [Acidimicrobiales bacterium]